MKKIVIIALAVSVLIGVTSCGVSDSAESGENGELYLYCYGDYYDPDIVADFEKETGIDVIEDTYDTAEEMYPVIKNSSADYDVICTSDYMIGKMINEDMLAKIDFDNVPEISNIGSVYMKKSEEFDPGNLYSVPYQVGVSGIMYNKSMVGDTVIDSWDDLWDPEFSGKILMQDSIRDSYMVALKKLGYSENTTDENEIKEATDALIEQKPLVYKYANDSARDNLANNSAAMGVVWNGEYMYVKELNDDIEFVVPKEGSEFFIDSWVINKDAQNKENAEAWINYLCKVDVAKKNFDYLHYTTPNVGAQELIDEELLNNEAIFPTEETIERCEGLKTLGSDADEMYSKYWKKVKAE